MPLFRLAVFVVVVAILAAIYRAATFHHGRYASTPRQTYDFVVVGGGTAGSLVAAELAAALPSHTILLLEAGEGVRDTVVSEQSVPGGAPDNVAFGNIDWNYRVEPQTSTLLGDSLPGFKERRYPIPRGKGLGGSNELNYMLHVRGTPDDYAVWEKATGGDARWGAASMQSAEEEYEHRIEHASKDKHHHAHMLAQAWVLAAGESKHGNMSEGVYNDGTQPRDGGFHYEHAVRNGVRQSTARQFLLPRLGLKNLDVVVGATVSQVVLEEAKNQGEEKEGASLARATGVRFTLAHCRVPALSVPVLGTLIPEMPCLFGGGRTTADVLRTDWQVEARKEIILSAGAYASPHILLRSGIGPRDELEAAGVTAKVDLPGVGKHLQDHPIVGIKYRLGPVGGSWLPSSVTKLWLALPSVPWAWLSRGHGILSSSGCDLGYFGASAKEFEGRPDLQIHGMITAGDMPFYRNFLHYEDAFLEDIGEASDYGVFAQGLVIAPTLLHPKAVGSVTLRQGGAGATGPPVIEFEAFDQQEDVDRLIEGIRRLQEIMAQPSMAAHAPTLLYARSLARAFGENTDEYWREYVKRFGFVVYHPTGTCRMGKVGEVGAVVDPALRVQRVAGLRVADASIMPDIVSGNTQVPTAAVAVQMVRMLVEQYFTE